ncbi:putative gluconokinase [Tetrabaena socialis]|uniref:Gluconokinase n=1 Tax=Tetrabaena socialis TaxID=47790 RepID=A0A2J7ZX41_9CHLO|nr:putative gluconokinase [Tetrabaena socialis]|eukprot:PNH04837.1 putative gluconokinase [Tetrabaena socialis]
MSPVVVVIMGVSGCGKSSVGVQLARLWNATFLEGDAMHTGHNLAKMASGVPLNDDDRLPWLLALHSRIRRAVDFRDRLVVACSALKPEYRHVLIHGRMLSDEDDVASETERRDAVAFVLLAPDVSDLRSRLERRAGHFFPASLLDTQLSTLRFEAAELFAHEVPDEDGVFPPPERIADRLASALLGSSSSGGSGASGGSGGPGTAAATARPP